MKAFCFTDAVSHMDSAGVLNPIEAKWGEIPEDTRLLASKTISGRTYLLIEHEELPSEELVCTEALIGKSILGSVRHFEGYMKLTVRLPNKEEQTKPWKYQVPKDLKEELFNVAQHLHSTTRF